MATEGELCIKMKKKNIIIILCVSVTTVLSLLLYTYITTNLKPFDVWLEGGVGFKNMPFHFEITSDKRLNITYNYFELGAEKSVSKKLTLKERKELKKLVDDVKKNANPKYRVVADGAIYIYVEIDGIEYETTYEMRMGGETVYNKQVEKLAHKLAEISPIEVFEAWKAGDEPD